MFLERILTTALFHLSVLFAKSLATVQGLSGSINDRVDFFGFSGRPTYYVIRYKIIYGNYYIIHCCEHEANA